MTGGHRNGKMIYLDNAATTKTAPEVVGKQCFLIYGNVWKSLQCI